MAQQVKIVRKGGFFGKLVALLLGIIIGIVAGIGGLAAILYYAFGVISIGEALGIVENSTSMDIPEEEYVGEEYLNKSLIQALTEAFGVVGGVASGSNTFGDISKISPYLGKTIGGLSTTFSQYGFEMTEDELLAMSAPQFGEYMQTSFGNIALAPLLTEIGGQSIDPSNTIMCALFYGQKGVHYQLVEEDGVKKVEMLPLCYTLEDDDTFTNWSDKIYAKSGEVWTNETGDGVIKAEPATSADETVTYAYAYYTVKDSVETLSYRLALKVGSTNEYEAYKLDDNKKLHVGATISGLLGNDLMNTMYSLPLADVLSLDANSDPLMLALAYGEDGYKVTGEDGNKEFEYLTDTPKTLNDLINGGSSLVTDMSIATLLNLDANSDPLMLALAYGEDGYKVAGPDGNKYFTYLTDTPKKLDDLVNGGSGLVTDISLATVMDLDMDNAESISAIMKALAFGSCDDPATPDDDLTANYKIVDNKIVMINDSKPKTVNALTGNTNDLVGDIKLGEIIEINSSSSQAMQSLKDTKVKDLSAKISSLQLQDVITIDSSSSVLMQSLATTKIDEIGTAVDDLEMSKIIKIETEGANKSSPILIALKDTKVKDLGAKVDTLTIKDVIEITETSPAILKSLASKNDGKGVLIKELGSAVDTLKIDEVITVTAESPKILKTLATKGVLIKDLGSAFNDLKIGEIIDGTENNKILKHLQGSKLSTLAGDIQTLKIQQIFGDDVYVKETYAHDPSGKAFVAKEEISGMSKYLYYNIEKGEYCYYDASGTKTETKGAPVLTGVWSFLLTENKVEKEYSIDQMGALVTNMTNNMQNATLKELHETGILNLTDVNLDEPKATLGGKTLGEYKIVDIVKVIGMMG